MTGISDPIDSNMFADLIEKYNQKITINKELLIDTLCEEFGITEGKMRRAIDKAIKKDKREEQ